jgi:3-hydroxyacyl-CoA dehydrogenase/enoyl-CoA hydratase/3-hydroxybutyryl-CoA epimerase
VFEDRKVKADVIKKIQAVIRDDATFASNTSTLPITSLAAEFKEPKRLWPGLADICKPKSADLFDVEELKQRLLAIQALETARCVEENVITDMRDADVGGILGFGFAPFTGGPLSYIDGMGTKAFVALCEKFAKKYGPRFSPGALLKEMAKKDESFYGRFQSGGKKAA